ncbi:MAG: hypothetical protein WAN43_07050 [Rhodomicrobium sp.]
MRKVVGNLILILSNPLDPHADLMVDHLRRRGALFERLHANDLPQEAFLTLQAGHGQSMKGSFTAQHTYIDVESVKSVWRRNTNDPEISSILSDDERLFAKAETAEGLFAFLGLMDAFWVNPPSNNRFASCKPIQLEYARQVGFNVPRTIFTNNPAKVAEFFDECNGQIVYKTLSQGKIGASDGRFIYTNTVLRDHLSDLDRVRFCLCQFQEHIAKSLDIRITIIGNQAFAVEIDTSFLPDARPDWRRFDLRYLRHEIHKLPEVIFSNCLKLVNKFGLNYGAIDMMLTPEGKYIFLEINPSGQFGWIEKKTGLKLTEALADLLIAGAV